MKKYSIVLQLFFICFILNANETIYLLDGKLSFQCPDYVIYYNTAPRFYEFETRDDYDRYFQEKIELSTMILTEQSLRNDYPAIGISEQLNELLKRKKDITRDDLLKLTVSNQPFSFNIVNLYGGTSYIPQSYYSIRHNETTIGETHMFIPSEKLLAPNAYTYKLSIILGNSIVEITLSLYDFNTFTVPRSMPELFIKSSDKYYWKNRNAVDTFYQKLNADNYSELPLKLQDFRKAYNLIVETLEMKEGCKIIKNVILHKPHINFVATHITTVNLRLRENQNMADRVITTLSNGTTVQVLEIGTVATIDGITAPWVWVLSSTGYTGWCFGGYLEEIKP
jgi:hypothetical protein